MANDGINNHNFCGIMEQRNPMNEIIKEDFWADVLDPNSKPYLVYDTKTSLYHILYWHSHFHYNKWQGSDWYDSPNPKRGAAATRKLTTYNVRVFELPLQEYQPVNITEGKTGLYRVVDEDPALKKKKNKK